MSKAAGVRHSNDSEKESRPERQAPGGRQKLNEQGGKATTKDGGEAEAEECMIVDSSEGERTLRVEGQVVEAPPDIFVDGDNEAWSGVSVAERCPPGLFPLPLHPQAFSRAQGDQQALRAAVRAEGRGPRIRSSAHSLVVSSAVLPGNVGGRSAGGRKGGKAKGGKGAFGKGSLEQVNFYVRMVRIQRCHDREHKKL